MKEKNNKVFYFHISGAILKVSGKFIISSFPKRRHYTNEKDFFKSSPKTGC